MDTQDKNAFHVVITETQTGETRVDMYTNLLTCLIAVDSDIRSFVGADGVTEIDLAELLSAQENQTKRLLDQYPIVKKLLRKTKKSK